MADASAGRRTAGGGVTAGEAVRLERYTLGVRTGDALFVRGREWDTDGIEPFVGRLSLADRRLVPSGKKAVVGQGDGTAVVWDTSK